MASQRTRLMVGIFVASGIVIAVLTLIGLGMSRFFQKGQYYSTYFNESVQGLDIDSPVKYRGVYIGRVERIGVAPDSKLIQVVLKIETSQKLDKDIVAQLKTVGITGSMFVELDRRKKDESDMSPPLSFPSDHPIVASKPSEISKLISSIDEILTQIKSVDLKEIANKIKLTLDNTNRMIEDANIKGISTHIESSVENIGMIFDQKRWDKILASVEEGSLNLNNLMDKANTGLTRLDGIIASNEDTVKTALDDFRLAMRNANTFLEKGSLLVSATDDSVAQLKNRLLFTAQSLQKASESLNKLLEMLSDHPSKLLFGEPPPPRDIDSVGTER
ncbi:MCE family protein [bacterium]|nr:MCE family protein [bacterium]